jgi:Domain of unknown function (DUF6456)
VSKVDRSLPRSAVALLAALATDANEEGSCARHMRINVADADLLVAADLARRGPDGRLLATKSGLARALRQAAADTDTGVDPFRAQHLSLARRLIATPDGPADVVIDEAESPLARLARRKARDGAPLLEPVQFQAGERLRGDFTRANLMPRVTSSWDASLAQGRRGQGGAGTFTDMMVAARAQVTRALDAVGPEFSGVLLDVCCFLKGLEDVERERRWPPRSAKVVLQLGLDRLARHYGLAEQVCGRARAPIRTWLERGSSFGVEG